MNQDVWQHRLDRERSARKQAEQLLEHKSLELYQANQQLLHLNQNLEKLVRERTQALEQANAHLQHEVNERQRAEFALRQGAAELRTLNPDLEEFAYLASHDLQEPLRKINVFAQMLREALARNLTPDAEDYLNRLSAAAERMHQMIRDLLQISRAGARDEQRNVLPDVLLQRVLGDLEAAIRESGAEIHAAPLPPVFAAPIQVEQLLRNLLSNAIKYRSKERKLEITILADKVQSGMVEIAVQDNGIGFDQQHAQRIFKPFQRLHLQEGLPGTGIGLAICRKIVERHGGTISAQGRTGQGATFRLTLPAARENQ